MAQMDQCRQSDPAHPRGSPLQLKWLDDLAAPDRDRFGSKSVNLALMARWGLPVPDGFAVAFEEGRSGILSPEEAVVLTAAYAELARRVGSSPLAVAVRSSAVRRGWQGVLLCGSVRDASRCDR